MSSLPRVVAKKPVFTCPWLSLIESQVKMKDPNLEDQAYYAIEQPDYVAIVALTPSGLLPIVRQYRPAVESFTLELPAGIVDKGEDPQTTAVRELREETGLIAKEVVSLGAFFPDTGRLSNLQHVFFIRTEEPLTGFDAEPGIEVIFQRQEEIEKSIRQGTFKHQLHVGAYFLAASHFQAASHEV